MSDMSFISGMFLGLSLIVAIGAQNIWVLSQSMAGSNRLVIAGVCIICDASLIVIGVYAANELQEVMPSILPWLKWGGILMLSYLALDAFSRAAKGTSGLRLNKTARSAWRKTAVTAFAISLLNPHVYLDTVVLLGSIGAQQTHPALFAMGACLASLLWFSGLSFFAPTLKGFLSSSRRWRLFDSIIGIVLLVVAVQLFLLN